MKQNPLDEAAGQPVDAMERITYNQHWEADWDDMKNYGPYARHLRRIVIDFIRPLQFNSVLDVGCGQGTLLTNVAAVAPHAELYGTDFSITALQMAKQRLPDAVFTIMDVTHNTYQAAFDLVLCTDVLEHIEDDVAAIQNLARLTKKYLLIATVQGRMRHHEPKAWGHVRNYHYGELVKKLQAAQLNVVRKVEWGFPFFSPLYRDVNAIIGGVGTSGKYGIARKTIAEVIYQVFRLNNNHRGDEIFVLAEKSQR
jgi:2-polyprenyl-3-methyl-5-hydroxy-6-metoxy-1,4-benzoquinol methylase